MAAGAARPGSTPGASASAQVPAPDLGMEPQLQHLVGQTIVVDTATRFMYLGVLREISERWVELAEVEVIDTEKVHVSRDLILIEKKRDGVKVGRRRVVVSLPSIISISALEDTCDL